MDILKPARDEIQSLEKTVSDAMTRLQDLRAFVDAGTRLYGPTQTALSRQAASPIPSAVGTILPVERAASQTKTSRIIAITERELSGGRHMPSNDLVASLKEHGIDLGAKPIASLSAYLSKSGRFVSERAKGGWTLKEQSHKEEAPQGVDAPAGPDLLDFSVPAKDTGTVAG